MPAYYPNEEDQQDGYPEQDIQDYMPANASQFMPHGKAVAYDQALSQGLPQAQAPAPMASMAPAASGIGAATAEYNTGRPGLFIQGGPTIPAGMISVNGQLERSQASPQPVPWWITQADEFRDQQRQENFLKGLLDQVQSQGKESGTKAINRARQLMGQMQLEQDVKGGMPFINAVQKNAANLYSGSPESLSRLASVRPPVKPFVPTTAKVGEEDLVQVSPNRWVIRQKTKPGVTPSVQLHSINLELNHLEKQREASSRDKTALANIDAREKELIDESRAIRKGEAPAATPATSAQTQTSPRIAKADSMAAQLKKDHPDWSDDKIKQSVIDAIRKLK